jgi:hypothetical protein
MDQTVFISSNNTATFRCPQCGKTKTADVNQHATSNKKITVTCTCVCGHQFRCRLEKRRQYRKAVNFPGRFKLIGKDGPEDTGLMTIEDISTTGLKFKTTVSRDFPTGTELLVEFSLDDHNRTPIEKRVIVRNVSGLFVGVSFHPKELDDPALGFYLMP